MGVWLIAIVFLVTLIAVIDLVWDRDDGVVIPEDYDYLYCESDVDCEMAYAGGGDCYPCSYADEGYECFEKEKAAAIDEGMLQKIQDEMIMCERCLETDYESYACECDGEKCEKVER